MKLREYAEKLQRLAKLHPDVVVVTSSDDEGNAFHEVFYSPCVGHFDGEEFDSTKVRGKLPNAVCLN